MVLIPKTPQGEGYISQIIKQDLYRIKVSKSVASVILTQSTFQNMHNKSQFKSMLVF